MMTENSEQEFADELTEALYFAGGAGYFSDLDVSVSTFEDEGLLTRNVGLVVNLSDGRTFQLTVRQSS